MKDDIVDYSTYLPLGGWVKMLRTSRIFEGHNHLDVEVIHMMYAASNYLKGKLSRFDGHHNNGMLGEAVDTLKSRNKKGA